MEDPINRIVSEMMENVEIVSKEKLQVGIERDARRLYMKICDGREMTLTVKLMLVSHINNVLRLIRDSITPPDEEAIDQYIEERIKDSWSMADCLTESELDNPEPNWPVPCHKCHKKTVFFQSVQIRCADEPATLFFLCLNCGAKWRKS